MTDAVCDDLVQQQHRQAEEQHQLEQLDGFRGGPQAPIVGRLSTQHHDQRDGAQHGEGSRSEVVGVEPTEVLAGQAVEGGEVDTCAHLLTLGATARAEGVRPLNAA